MLHCRDAWPFLEPVSKAQAPDYLEVVQRPMDLGTVLRRLDDDHYTSPEAMFNDTLLVFDNAQVYNASEHLIHQMAKDLKVGNKLVAIAQIAQSRFQ